ncbi:universal stress protein [Caballeronia catudaia]|uniref:universal stress protein n=1 Tax=Caballeronia catudaia TaxID=1777136 RepID=UPI002E15FCB5
MHRLPAGRQVVALQRILFAIDGSPTSFAALATGTMLATPDTHIRVVYVVDRALRGGGAPAAILEDTMRGRAPARDPGPGWEKVSP